MPASLPVHSPTHLDADAYKDLTRHTLLATLDPNGELTTSLLPGLEDSRVVTITYAYLPCRSRFLAESPNLLCR